MLAKSWSIIILNCLTLWLLTSCSRSVEQSAGKTLNNAGSAIGSVGNQLWKTPARQDPGDPGDPEDPERKKDRKSVV